MSKRPVELYIQDIRESINKLEKYTKGVSFNVFSTDQEKVDAVVRNLEIIGEAVNNIPEKIREKAPEVPWKEIIGMRNKLTHEYFGVDLEIVWKTLKKRLPELKKGIKKLSDK